MNVIRTDNLQKYFEGVKAVDGISFEVPAGIVFGFLGPNGSGKTTTIRLLLGLFEPTAGRAEVLGLDTRNQSDEIRRRCGALLENTGLYERLSAEDNLDFFGRVWHMPTAQRQARIQELLTGFGLWERRKDVVANWSRGMRQKLGVARTLMHRPELVFMDEPTAGLDPLASAALREDLSDLAQRQGVTVFLTTHNLAEAEKLCQLVAVIRQGKLLMIGSPDELRMRQGHRQLEVVGRGFNENVLSMLRQRPDVSSLETHDHHVTIDLKGEPDTSELVRTLVQAGVQVDEVRKGAASLEEVFLESMEEKEAQV